MTLVGKILNKTTLVSSIKQPNHCLYYYQSSSDMIKRKIIGKLSLKLRCWTS